MDPFIDSVITEEYFHQRPHMNFFNRLFYNTGLKNYFPFAESRSFNPLEPQRSAHWYGRSPHADWVDGILDYTYNKFNVNSIGHFHMHENRKNKPQKSHSGGDRNYFLVNTPEFAPVPLPTGCSKEVSKYTECKNYNRNFNEYFAGKDMKKLKDDYSRISSNISNSVSDYLKKENHTASKIINEVKEGKKDLNDIIELLPSKNDIRAELKDFSKKYGSKVGDLITTYNHSNNEKSVLSIIQNRSSLSPKSNNCVTEKISIVEVCPKWALEALREKKKLILKCTVIDNRNYRNAMRIEDYNKDRSLRDIKDKYAYLRNIRSESYWADDRYNPSKYPSPDHNTNVNLGNDIVYNDVLGGNNIEKVENERIEYNQKLDLYEN